MQLISFIISKITLKDIGWFLVLVGILIISGFVAKCERDKLLAKIDTKDAIISLKDQTISVAKNQKGQTVYHSSTATIDKGSIKDAIASSPELKSIIASNKIHLNRIESLTYQVSQLQNQGILRWHDSSVTINNTETKIKVASITDPKITPYIKLELEDHNDTLSYHIEVYDTLSNVVLWKRKKVAKWLFGGLPWGSKEYEMESVHANPFMKNTVQKSLIVNKK